MTATDCGRGLCAVAGRCLVPCVSDAECASSARCAEVYVRTAAGSLQPNDACIPRFEAPPGTRAAAVSFTFDAAAGDATAPTLRHAMGGVSQLVVEESRPEVDVQLGIVSLRCAGRTLWDPFVFSPTSPPPLNAVSARDDVANVFLPLGPGAAALPTCDTELVLRAQTPGTGPVALHGFSALSYVSFRGGVVDLDLYFVGGGGFTGDAGLPAPLRAALDDAQRILLARVGVRFGDIRLHEVVGGLRARFAVLEAVGDPISFPDLAALFRLGGGTPTRSVDVFLLRDLTPALGVAGGIPGPSGAHGYGGSGIAIGVDGVAQTMGEYPLGRVLAHELGHFLGLFHTSEADGSVFDPLPDTPECRLAPNDRDGDGVLTPSECAGTGGDHLMFWSAGGDAVSDGQRAVLARALVFR